MKLFLMPLLLLSLLDLAHLASAFNLKAKPAGVNLVDDAAGSLWGLTRSATSSYLRYLIAS